MLDWMDADDDMFGPRREVNACCWAACWACRCIINPCNGGADVDGARGIFLVDGGIWWWCEVDEWSWSFMGGVVLSELGIVLLPPYIWRNWLSIRSFSASWLFSSWIEFSLAASLFLRSVLTCSYCNLWEDCACFKCVTSFLRLSFDRKTWLTFRPFELLFIKSCFNKNFVLCFTTSICLTKLKHKSERGRALLFDFDCFEKRAWSDVFAMSAVALEASATTSSVKSVSFNVLEHIGHCEDCSKCE